MPNRETVRNSKSDKSEYSATSVVLLEWFSKTWVLAFIGAVLYWFSLPPVKIPWAAYLSAACWVSIIAKECNPTRAEYFRIWLAGCVMWLALLQGVRLAFWPLYAGWIALSLYLAVYLPIFVAMSRSLNRTWYVPLPIAAATAWVGCELIRAYFVTGFAACMLAHSQVPWPWMLPVASHLGCYGVSFVVMFFGAVIYLGITRAFCKPHESASARRRGVLAVAGYTFIALGFVGISVWSVRSRDTWIANQESIQPLGRVLLIQDDMPTQFDGPLEDSVLGWRRYEQQTAIAAETHQAKKIDLVVWPESTFIAGPSEEFLMKPCPDWIEKDEYVAEFGLSKNEFPEYLKICVNATKYKVVRLLSHFKQHKPFLLLGVDVLKVRPDRNSRYNAAIWVDPAQVDSRPEYYAKQHLVLFGETFPFISGLLSAIGLGVGGIDAGDGPMAFTLPSGSTVSTSICFEDVLPHLIHSHVRQLRVSGKSPDMLVNITNDGWFRGSSILDHHLNNAIMSAVENRMPMLVAANLGISAWIDGDGRVIRSLPRLEGGSILAEPLPDNRWGMWQSVGDLPAKGLAIVSCLPSLIWLAKRMFRKRNLPR